MHKNTHECIDLLGILVDEIAIHGKFHVTWPQATLCYAQIFRVRSSSRADHPKNPGEN